MSHYFMLRTKQDAYNTYQTARTSTTSLDLHSLHIFEHVKWLVLQSTISQLTYLSAFVMGQLLLIITHSVSCIISLSTAVFKGCHGGCRLSMWLACCVLGQDKRDTMHISDTYLHNMCQTCALVQMQRMV